MRDIAVLMLVGFVASFEEICGRVEKGSFHKKMFADSVDMDGT